jgi:hypothetical protein
MNAPIAMQDIQTFTTSWSGGNTSVITTHYCKKCGTRFKYTFDCITKKTKIEVMP